MGDPLVKLEELARDRRAIVSIMRDLHGRWACVFAYGAAKDVIGEGDTATAAIVEVLAEVAP